MAGTNPPPALAGSEPESPLEQTFVFMSDQTGPVVAPPDRLAERLYRRSLARRKSSSSSRRNSLGSSHSHGSSRHHHHHHHRHNRSSSHSHHVAQHLRRASIIESRKARLADRAAHVEQVRMRAALIQAIPKATITSSEERAVAAAIAREKCLAKVVAACAEEVAKAKQRALQTKAKRLEDEQKIRQEMEDRWAEADRRRAEYQRDLHARRLRRASSPAGRKLAVVIEDADSEPALDEDTAVRRIQRTWRLLKRRAAVNTYLALDFSLDSVRNKPFDELGMLLNSSTLLDSVTAMLKLLNLAIDGSSSRTFLSAYLIISHPSAVFSKHSEQEQDLMDKSRELTVLFESAISRLALWNRYLPSSSHRNELHQAFTTYSAAFEAWKAHDVSGLLDVMVATFVEFDAIWTSVKDDTRGHVADDYKEAVRDNQAMLLSKIRKLVGPQRADLVIKKAIREARRARKPKRTIEEEQPRVADAPITPKIIDSYRAAPIDFSDPSRPYFPSNSPIPSNRILTHELAIDENFRLEDLDSKASRGPLVELLCASMQKGMERGEGTQWTLSMAECIRGKLSGLIKPSDPIANLVARVLDAEHVQTQCEQGVFSYESFFDFMATILPKICAPFRDADMKAYAAELSTPRESETQMFSKLSTVLHCIDLLALDHTNYMLSRAAPILIREAPGYERRMFERDLREETHTLEIATDWFNKARDELERRADMRDPEQVRIAADRPTINSIYNHAMAELAVSPSPWAKVPETLALDWARLEGIRCTMLQMVCVGATLLTAKNLLKRDVRNPWKFEGQKIMELFAEEFDVNVLADRAYVIIESTHGMPPSAQMALKAACERHYKQLASYRLTDPVMRLMHSRLKTHILQRLSATTSEERVRAISTAGESIARAGLPEFVSHIGHVVAKLSKIKQVDMESHETWYKQIFEHGSSAGTESRRASA